MAEQQDRGQPEGQHDSGHRAYALATPATIHFRPQTFAGWYRPRVLGDRRGPASARTRAMSALASRLMLAVPGCIARSGRKCPPGRRRAGRSVNYGSFGKFRRGRPATGLASVGRCWRLRVTAPTMTLIPSPRTTADPVARTADRTILSCAISGRERPRSDGLLAEHCSPRLRLRSPRSGTSTAARAQNTTRSCSAWPRGPGFRLILRER